MKQQTTNDLRRFVDWAPLALVIGVFVYLYAFFGYLTAYGPHLSVTSSMLKLFGYEEWEHCALIPFVVAFLVWTKRRLLQETPVNPAPIGLVGVAVSLGLFWVSYRLDDIYFAFLSIQLVTASLVIAFAGWAWMKVLIFPWMFLVFAWPLFFLDNVIAFPLRVIMSTASTATLNVLGVHAVQVGTAIQSAPAPLAGLPRGALFQVDVANPCGGMRSLFALMMVSALYGYFAIQSVWKRWVLFAAAIPLAILGNLVRIIMLTVGILIFGPKIAIGTEEAPSFYHMACGFFVFLVALSGMTFVGFVLQGRHKKWIAEIKATKRPSLRADKPRTVESVSPVTDIY